MDSKMTDLQTQPPENKLLLDPALPLTGLPDRTVGDFWQWAYSDVLSNRNRSIFAEYLVGVALDAVGSRRAEWDSVDLRYRDAKIEVKSAADLQAAQKDEPAKVQFSIRKSTDAAPPTGGNGGESTRFADVYVFAHYLERDAEKADVLDVGSWDFYVVGTKSLNAKFGDGKSIALASLQRIAKGCKFDALRDRVDAAISRQG
jgi:hypothetical protein